MNLFDHAFHLFWQKIARNRPKLVRFAAPPYYFSSRNKNWDTNARHSIGVGGWFECSNHSFGYHGVLRQFWDSFGFGKKCLLISETKKVAAEFHQKYPQTEFIATDYYLELHSKSQETDIVWNLYEEPPGIQVDSIVCQATFEHLMDPVGVLNRFLKILSKNGHVYLHTHTPVFPYHPFPKDYLRYNPEWFVDLPEIITGLRTLEVICVYNHAFAVFQKTD
jgi:hypothetical protein